MIAWLANNINTLCAWLGSGGKVKWMQNQKGLKHCELQRFTSLSNGRRKYGM